MALFPKVQSTSVTHGRSVRQRILDALKAKIEAMEENGEVVWRYVYMGDPEEVGNERTPLVAIDQGTEEKLQSYGGCTSYNLPVFFHMRWQSKQGLDAQDRYLYYLALLQKTVLGDHNLGGLTLNVEEDSNAHTIIGLEDAYPGGTLTVVLTYKTRLHNPFKSPHEPL